MRIPTKNTVYAVPSGALVKVKRATPLEVECVYMHPGGEEWKRLGGVSFNSDWFSQFAKPMEFAARASSQRRVVQ